MDGYIIDVHLFFSSTAIYFKSYIRIHRITGFGEIICLSWSIIVRSELI